MLKESMPEDKYLAILERNRQYKKTEEGAERTRVLYRKYYSKEETKAKKRQYYLMKKEEKLQKYIAEHGTEPPKKPKGRPRLYE